VHDKRTFFAGVDVFCLPSHHEPFGIVLIEAMAHAMPVVSTTAKARQKSCTMDPTAFWFRVATLNCLVQALGGFDR